MYYFHSGNPEVSVLQRCPSYGMSVLRSSTVFHKKFLVLVSVPFIYHIRLYIQWVQCSSNRAWYQLCPIKDSTVIFWDELLVYNGSNSPRGRPNIKKLIIAPMNSRNLDYMDFKQWVQGSRREKSYQNVVYWPQNSVYPGFLLSQ